MWIDIVVLRAGEPPIASWRYQRNSLKEFVIADQLSGESYSPIEAWKNLSGEINRRSVLRPHNGAEVFLKWRFPLAEDLADLDAWTTLIDNARDYSWGGRVYLACKKSELNFDQLCTDEGLEIWLAMIGKSGLTAMIEVDGDDDNLFFNLATSAQASRRRHKQLHDFVTDRGWIAIFRGAEPIETVVRGLVEQGVVPADSENEVIVYEREPKRNDLENLRRRSRWASRKGSAFRADITGKKKKLQFGPEAITVHFSGVLEWLDAFIKLNQTRRVPRQKLVTRNEERVVWVEAPRNAGAYRKKTERGQCLLVTSAMGPDDLDDGHGATVEIGACLRQLTFDIEVEVHQCVSCEMLPDLLAPGKFTAWLHISHGKKGFGLREALSPGYASAERWKHCFDAYQGRLELVMLSACESADIALELSKRGIGVAIGFDREVYVKAARIVTETVIPAAFEHRHAQRAILDAFERAYLELASRSYLDKGQLRYYSDCLPKVFASRKPS